MIIIFSNQILIRYLEKYLDFLNASFFFNELINDRICIVENELKNNSGEYGKKQLLAI